MHPPSPMVGRAAELALLRARVDAAGRGEGGAVLVTGEAGIGKSRLVAEATARAAAAGRTVLVGCAVDGGGTFRAVAEALAGPLRVLRDPAPPLRAALARLVPGWASGPVEWEPQVDPAVLLGEAVLALLHGAGPGCVLVLEDLHWADVDTLRLAGYLARAVPAAGVLLLLTARDDGLPAPELARLTADPGVRTVPLHRLEPASVAALAASRRGGAALPAPALRALVARADGLPLLVEELAEDGGPDVPPSLAALVAARLAALGPAERAVVTAAAVAGDPDVPVLAAVTGTADAAVVAALRAATERGLLRPEPGGLRWRHALTREAVLAGLLAPERALLAARTAEVLEARGSADDHALAADLHLVAGRPDRAADAFLGLARADTARGALHSAVALLSRAAATGRRPVAVAVERVGVLSRLGRVVEARAVGSAALRDGTVTGDDHAELCLLLARAAVGAGEWAAAEEYVARAGRPADPRSLVLRADAAYGAGDAGRSTGLAAAAVHAAETALAARPGSAQAAATLCEALGVAARRAMVDDLDRASMLLRRAVQIAGEHGLAPWEVEALFHLGAAELMAGDPVAPSLAAARELGSRTGALLPAVQARLLSAEAALHVDGPRAGLPRAREAGEEAGRLGLTRLQAMAELVSAGLAALADEPLQAGALLAAARGRAAVPREVETLHPMVDGLTALLDHDLPRAARSVDAGVSALMPHGSAASTGFFGLWILLRTLVADRDAEARAALRAHHAVVTRVNRAGLTYAEAVVAGREGRADDAVRLFAGADAALARLPWWNRLLRSLVLEAAVADGWGDPVPLLRADLAEHERAGADKLARTCRDLLRRAGSPTRRRGATHVPAALRARGVTSREVDVLALVAGGLSNAEVADRLFVSPRTVETHVAHLLAKTGAADRTQLRAWVGPARPG
ncbi:ATP-binding protein [Pseudonocardia broussonetiae]|uniref:AAA family ATPase n=1 Tax=Pseudonocardia broussonetiae TaxID=2736640 RepID=A0A6M6JHR2_9PSEU|nr:LuxR family transcriptional regulator [Pseudonocardia broussonetiae]QJY46590.1 AAA family ATPase [Pseudonocardia broussonetiae]